ncbi:uncharacterized protein LOC141835059 [Curcuma longa]|uniref:uncharacterized protein LOC141835059 n=1 Tax=Curcuma longa TaxID=136217 RepID=UPI003D9F53B3
MAEYSCISYPALEGDFELVSSFIHLLPKFQGLPGEDPTRYLLEFHVVCSTMKPYDISECDIKLRAFPFSLTGSAKEWLYYLPTGYITNWIDMKKEADMEPISDSLAVEDDHMSVGDCIEPQGPPLLIDVSGDSEDNYESVICDCYTPAGKPIPTNKRYNGAKIFSHPNIVDEEPWYGIKQEYTLSHKDVKWPLGGFPHPQGPCYYSAGVDKSFGCDIVDAHHKACLYAGINISGTDGEVMPGQWKFQVGPAASSSVGNQLWAARYILERITEIAGVVLSFDSKPFQISDTNSLLCSASSNFLLVDKLVNMDDHLLKPFLLFHLMCNELPEKSFPMSAPRDLSYILDMINIHDLLSEQLVNPSDVMLMETWRATMDAWSEHVICLTCSKEPKRCWVGVSLLGLTCGNCSSARFLASYSGWFKNLLSIIEVLIIDTCCFA